MADAQAFQIASYNCRGFNSTKRAYIKSLFINSVVLFLQEHWVSLDQLKSFGDFDGNFIHTGVSGFDNSDILVGRPCGGCSDVLLKKEVGIRR